MDSLFPQFRWASLLRMPLVHHCRKGTAYSARLLGGALLCLGAFFSLGAQADSGSASEQLRQFISQVQQAQGEFSQQTTTVDGQAQPKQQGQFAFDRGQGQFRWQVLQPYEQLILADGKHLIQYDPDLSQATQRGLEDTIGSSPAAILFGTQQLDQGFDLEDRASEQGLQWLRATPTSADAGFQAIDIGFDEGLPVQLIIKDGFGQQTVVELSGLDTAVSFDDDEFNFVVPDGVDFIELQ